MLAGEPYTTVRNFANLVNSPPKFLWLPKALQLGDRLKGWRVCWLGGWDKNRIWFVVMAERKCGLATGIAHRRTSGG